MYRQLPTDLSAQQALLSSLDRRLPSHAQQACEGAEQGITLDELTDDEDEALWEITFASGCGFGCASHRCDHAASSFPMHPLTCVVVAHSESDFREGSTCGSAVSGVAKFRTAGSA